MDVTTTIYEKGKNIPVVAGYDVIVAGGGIAGISAALAAAEEGKKVLLIEREYLLGGLATLGLVTFFLPVCDGNGNLVVGGIGKRLLELSYSHGAETPLPEPWLKYLNGERVSKTSLKENRAECRYNAGLFAILAERLLIDAGVKIAYGSLVTGAAVKRNKITHLIVENKGGRQAYAVRSVVDATGDSDVARVSGALTATFGAGNILAAWYYRNGKDTPNDVQTLGFCDGTIKKENSLDTTKKYYGLTEEDLSEQVIDSHASLLNHFLKNGELTDTHTLNAVATIPQIRMTRRIVGKTTLDIYSDKKITDCVGLIPDWKKRGVSYKLPYSALYSANVKNLIAAGRNISVTDDSWDVTRVIPVCAVSGEAAGVAAANTSDFAKYPIKELRKKLSARGVILKI